MSYIFHFNNTFLTFPCLLLIIFFIHIFFSYSLILLNISSNLPHNSFYFLYTLSISYILPLISLLFPISILFSFLISLYFHPPSFYLSLYILLFTLFSHYLLLSLYISFIFFFHLLTPPRHCFPLINLPYTA